MAQHAQPLGYVASEGGPFLLMDARSASEWLGIDSDDYERACALLEKDESREGGVIAVGSSVGIVWDLGGAGSARVFRCNNDVALVRWWGPAPDVEPDASLLRLPAVTEKDLGELELTSSTLLILWATENGSGILGIPAPPEGPVRGDLSVAQAGLVVRCSPGRYQVTHDTFSDEKGSGRRCWVRQAH